MSITIETVLSYILFLVYSKIYNLILLAILILFEMSR